MSQYAVRLDLAVAVESTDRYAPDGVRLVGSGQSSDFACVRTGYLSLERVAVTARLSLTDVHL